MTALTIARLAAAGGVGVETVRYYQRRGLLAVPERDAARGSGAAVRRYDTADAQRLRFIRSAKSAGFTLGEIGELLALDASEDRARAQQLAATRIAALDQQIAALTAARTALSRVAVECSRGDAGPCPIITAFEG